ncbi:YraN family protein [bacterium]|nr:YraN family protein [candidate division CSSED10-310 bacterium]
MTRMQKNIGDLGEGFARGYLVRQGYRILHSPFRCRIGEIDIVAVHNDVLVFIEVKTRRGDRFGSGLDAVDSGKQRKIIRAAKYYLKYKLALPLSIFRFDVLAINQGVAGQPPELRHIQDAFRDDGSY